MHLSEHQVAVINTYLAHKDEVDMIWVEDEDRTMNESVLIWLVANHRRDCDSCRDLPNQPLSSNVLLLRSRIEDLMEELRRLQNVVGAEDFESIERLLGES